MSPAHPPDPVRDGAVQEQYLERYACHLPAARAVIDGALALDGLHFAESTGMGGDWYPLNPNILIALTLLGTDEVVGFVEYVPLREPIFSRLIAGEATEIDVGEEHVLSPHEARGCSRLYCASVCLRPIRTPGEAARARYMRRRAAFEWAWMKTIAEVYLRDGQDAVTLYGLVLSQRGARYARASLFETVPGLAPRTDGGVLVARTVTRGDALRWMAEREAAAALVDYRRAAAAC
jgi:hypothetical protein